ncbi:MAG: DUF559 domain-containing protein [Candidatus Berkiella sp.]
MSSMLDASRKLRKESTFAEQKLWFYLRDKRFCHIRFKRQYVIKCYIVDFICLKHKLIIEVDGSQHLDNRRYDENRTHFLEELGFYVVRFWNHEVLKNTKDVLEKIYLALE